MSYYFTNKHEVFKNICAMHAGCYSFKSIGEVFLARYARGEINQKLLELALTYADEMQDVFELTESRMKLVAGFNSYKANLTNWLSDPRGCYVKNGQ